MTPMRRSPHQLISGRDRARTKVPHATLRGVEGAPRSVGPIFETAYCSHAYTRSPSTLDWYVRLFCDQDSQELAAQINLSQRHLSVPDQFRDSAIRQSTACVPPRRSRYVECGPWRSRRAGETRHSKDYWAGNGAKSRYCRSRSF